MGKNKTIKKKFIPKECTDKMTFDDCELAILRHAVHNNEKIAGQKIASSDEIKKMIDFGKGMGKTKTAVYKFDKYC